MHSYKIYSLAALSGFTEANRIGRNNRLFDGELTTPENQNLMKSLGRRARREVVSLRDENSDLGAELALFYDACHQSDLEKHVLKNSEFSSISCSETKDDGLSCKLSCDAGYYIQETAEESRSPSADFSCYKLPFAKSFFYWTYTGSDDEADFKRCEFNGCPSGVDLGGSLFKFKEQFSDRATAIFTVNPGLIEGKLNAAGMGQDFASQGWTFVLKFNKALSAKTSFHIANGRHLSTNKNGDAIAFTSLENNRDILTLGKYALELSFSSTEENFIPENFAIESLEIMSGEFTNIQCQFGHENITEAGIWSEDLSSTVSLTNHSHILEADFSENVIPFEFGGAYTQLVDPNAELNCQGASEENSEVAVVLPDPEFDSEGWLKVETDASECLYWKPYVPAGWVNEAGETDYTNRGAYDHSRPDHNNVEKICKEQHQDSRLAMIMSQQELEFMQTQVIPLYKDTTWNSAYGNWVGIHVDLVRNDQNAPWIWNDGERSIPLDTSSSIFQWAHGNPTSSRHCAIYSNGGQSEAVTGFNTNQVGFRSFPCAGDWSFDVYYVCERRCD